MPCYSDEGIGTSERRHDAVTIAAPDHWHVPAALLALGAGKHAYVEKPCCHNVREGQLLVAATRKSGKVFAHGTQSRSSVSFQKAINLLRESAIGDVLVAKCWNWQKRNSIGHMQPSSPPAGIDYDAGVGPAEWMPYQANRFHYNWHWWYNFGCGDLGNDGIHELDYALWGLGVESHPSVISAVDRRRSRDAINIIYKSLQDDRDQADSAGVRAARFEP